MHIKALLNEQRTRGLIHAWIRTRDGKKIIIIIKLGTILRKQRQEDRI